MGVRGGGFLFPSSSSSQVSAGDHNECTTSCLKKASSLDSHSLYSTSQSTDFWPPPAYQPWLLFSSLTQQWWLQEDFFVFWWHHSPNQGLWIHFREEIHRYIRSSAWDLLTHHTPHIPHTYTHSLPSKYLGLFNSSPWFCLFVVAVSYHPQICTGSFLCCSFLFIRKGRRGKREKENRKYGSQMLHDSRCTPFQVQQFSLRTHPFSAAFLLLPTDEKERRNRFLMHLITHHDPDLLPGGWWFTSSAFFGRRKRGEQKLELVKELINRMLGRNVMCVGGEAWLWLFFSWLLPFFSGYPLFHFASSSSSCFTSCSRMIRPLKYTNKKANNYTFSSCCCPEGLVLALNTSCSKTGRNRILDGSLIDCLHFGFHLTENRVLRHPHWELFHLCHEILHWKPDSHADWRLTQLPVSEQWA